MPDSDPRYGRPVSDVRLDSAASSRLHLDDGWQGTRLEELFMEKCYVCNHCGKCDEQLLAIPIDSFVCLDCGHLIQPGESRDVCNECGGKNIGVQEGRPVR